MTTSVKDIANSINESDTTFDAIIQNFLDDSFYTGNTTTVAAWRTANYVVLRKWFYPKPEVFLDAMVKINSKDSELATEGQEQLDKYYTDCLAVKTRFVKESLTIIEE